MLRQAQGARRYTDRLELLKSDRIIDELGHAHMGEPYVVKTVFGNVSRMSETKTLATFEQANIVGVDIELRYTSVDFNGIRWRGHTIALHAPEDVDNRHRTLRVAGYYQQDNP